MIEAAAHSAPEDVEERRRDPSPPGEPYGHAERLLAVIERELSGSGFSDAMLVALTELTQILGGAGRPASSSEEACARRVLDRLARARDQASASASQLRRERMAILAVRSGKVRSPDDGTHLLTEA